MKKLFLVAMLVLLASVAMAADISETVYNTESAKATESNSLENAVADCRTLKKDLDAWLIRMVKYDAALGTYTDANFKAGLVSFYQTVKADRDALVSGFPVILTGDDGSDNE